MYPARAGYIFDGYRRPSKYTATTPVIAGTTSPAFFESLSRSPAE
jgi:hypothetical protein